MFNISRRDIPETAVVEIFVKAPLINCNKRLAVFLSYVFANWQISWNVISIFIVLVNIKFLTLKVYILVL